MLLEHCQTNDEAVHTNFVMNASDLFAVVCVCRTRSSGVHKCSKMIMILIMIIIMIMIVFVISIMS